jgi:hypothetical protein
MFAHKTRALLLNRRIGLEMGQGTAGKATPAPQRSAVRQLHRTTGESTPQRWPLVAFLSRAMRILVSHLRFGRPAILALRGAMMGSA